MFVKQLTWKDMKVAIRKTSRLVLRNARDSLTNGHRILSMFWHDKASYPRSDRVFVFLAYLLSQLWIIGLFQNSGVIQPMWVCTPTLSDELLWAALTLNGTNGDDSSIHDWVQVHDNNVSSIHGLGLGWCRSECASNSTIVKQQPVQKTSSGPKKGKEDAQQQPPLTELCARFCDCEKRAPELVYIISHAILVALLSSVPVTLMVVLFELGHQKVIKADASYVIIRVHKLNMAITSFELQRATFVAVMGDAAPSAAGSFDQLIGCFRAAVILLEMGETGGEQQEVVSFLIEKQERYYWADFLLTHVLSMENLVRQRQQSKLRATTELLLGLEIVQESSRMFSVIEDCAKAKQNADKTHDRVKVANKNRRMGVAIITLTYLLVIVYILCASWFVVTYALQSGPADTKLWLDGFFNTFLLDNFIFAPANLVVKGVFFLPMIRYLKPAFTEIKDYVSSLYGMCIITVRRRIRNRSRIKVLPQGVDDGDGEDGDGEASPTEKNAMDRVERGDEDHGVGLIDNNADEEVGLPNKFLDLAGPPSNVLDLVGPPSIFLDLVGPPSIFLDLVGPPSKFLDLVSPPGSCALKRDDGSSSDS